MFRRLRYYSTAVFSLYLLGACSSNTPFESPREDNLANFPAIQTKILDQSCAVSGCHAGPNPASDLNLSAGQAYDQLIGKQSVLFPPLQRVSSRKSDESVLVLILRGDLQPQMPLGRAPLSNAEIDSIALWIDTGAAKN